MNTLVIAVRRPVATLTLLAAALGFTFLGVSILRPDVFRAAGMPGVFAFAEQVGESAEHVKGFLESKYESFFKGEGGEEGEGHHAEAHKVVVTTPTAKDVTLTQQYVCQIHSQRHINVCAMENGFLEEILVKEGQPVRKGDVMFRIVPTLYQAKLDAENAEAQLAQLEYNNTRKLFQDNVVSKNEVALLQAKLAKAQAKAHLALAELNFTYVRAPFDGIVDRLQEQLGSLIKEGDVLTTLSDNRTMWVYFNVPEARYLEYMADVRQKKDQGKIELVLANGQTFDQPGRISTIEAKFNNETGNIPFRADFPNPDGLLRHGQTGNILIHKVAKDSVVIPQRATFEILDKRYVYVVDKDDVVHQREVLVANEMDDIFVLKKGVEVGEKIVLEGIRQVKDGEKVDYEFKGPEMVIAQLKNRAE